MENLEAINKILSRSLGGSLYLPRSKALFLHLPRTGGTWVKRAVMLCGIEHELLRMTPRYRRKHALLAWYPAKFLADVDFVFSTVRHPVSYYESRWRYATRHRPPYSRKRVPDTRRSPWEPDKYYQPDFGEWARYMVENRPCWVTRLYEQFVGPEHGEFCQFICHTETLTDDFCRVMSLLGYGSEVEESRVELPKLYRSANKSKIVATWPEGLQERVAHDERLTIERFYGEETIEEVGKRIFDEIIEVANGNLTRSEIMGHRDFVLGIFANSNQ